MSEKDVLLRKIDRSQMFFRVVDVEQLIEQDHPARWMWEAVGRLDLKPFYECIGCNPSKGGRPTFAPQLLISVWVYAYSRGIGKAREVARLTGCDPAFQWLTGMEKINYHTLADFRVDKKKELDKLFTHLLGVLSAEGLVSLERVTVDGTKIKALASGKTFRREETLQKHLEAAQKQVEALSDPHGKQLSGRQKKARERALREKKERLEQAMKQMKKLKEEKGSEEEKAEVRVSGTDPEARCMKQSEGGYGPNYNAQISTDGKQGVIVDADITQAGNDYGQLLPAMKRVEERNGKKPEQALVDSGYISHGNVEAMAREKIDLLGGLSADDRKANGSKDRYSVTLFRYDPEQNCFICPAHKVLKYEGRQHKDGQISHKYKARNEDCANCSHRAQCCGKNKKHGRSVVRREETAAMIAFRTKMATPSAQDQYRLRAQIAEFPNAWIKAKLGLRQFHVRGLIKVKAELLWACLTYNLQTWIRWRKNQSPLAGAAVA